VRDDRPAASTDAPAVWFAYSPDRKGRWPQEHLKRFTGQLQADGYAGFNALYENGPVNEVACWAHVRRKFVDIADKDRLPIAIQAIERISKLYAVEKQIRGQPPDQRLAIRQAHAGPLLDELKQWLHDQLSKTLKKSSLANAIRYALTRWTALTRYVDDGHLEIDNNAVEREIRPIVMARSLCTPFISACKHWNLILRIDSTRAAFTGHRLTNRFGV
ncbi:MAG: IS66 family transposase, partial [Burkholderiaceae bacterium]